MKNLQLDYGFMMEAFIGAEGLTEADIQARQQKLTTAAKEVLSNRAAMAWWDLPYTQTSVVQEILAYAAKIRKEADAFVVLGIGGSALGPMAVQLALNHPLYNELPVEKRGGPKFYVLDNVDPERLTALFDVINPAKTVFNCISKSGDTVETMSQFLILQDLLAKKIGKENLANHFVCTTGKTGTLRDIAQSAGYQTFTVPDGVGGRFSELCPVGLLPAAVCGIDIIALLEGAAALDQRCTSENVLENPAFLYGALQCMAAEKGKNIAVLMPYADRLRLFGDWFAQLWAESLGKKFDTAGNVVHVGQTPVKALGVTDQHSQMQLYAEGPFDKTVTFLGLTAYPTSVSIPKNETGLSYLGDVTYEKLIQVEQWSTEYALMEAGRPSMTLTLPELSAHAIGQLILFFELATAFSGAYLGINTFDQPGVEGSKQATYAYFGKPGYEEEQKKRSQLPIRPKNYHL